MIWVVVGKTFINQSFTKNKAAINGKNSSNISMDISAEIYLIKKVYPLRDATFGADFLTPLRILKNITVGLKNGF